MTATRSKKPVRSLRLIRPFSTLPACVRVAITSPGGRCRRESFYIILPVRSDLGPAGYELRKLGAPRTYHVLIGRSYELSCECLGWLRHEKPCIHLQIMAGLLRSQKI